MPASGRMYMFGLARATRMRTSTIAEKRSSETRIGSLKSKIHQTHGDGAAAPGAGAAASSASAAAAKQSSSNAAAEHLAGLLEIRGNRHPPRGPSKGEAAGPQKSSEYTGSPWSCQKLLRLARPSLRRCTATLAG